jgi:hypothetical protein
VPVKQMKSRELGTDARLLVDQLVAEWSQPDPSAAQPVILEERTGPGGAVHVYVVWDAWATIEGIERSEIIMEAFIRRYGQDASSDVTVAMGLTPVEADRLRIPYKD